ncbi:TPA: hypothetical protein DEB00_00470 [Candidatus Uhrbacteria bacterium]|nr:hypothetical protein [Candidatus Uhrbacteria bacterium]
MKWVIWPTLDDELGDKRGLLTGKVLNAGCGTRRPTLPNASEVHNLDIFPGEDIGLVGSIENIPIGNEEFDSVLNIAVLEHVERPWVAVKEMARVLKPGGTLVCCVPFFQPVHKVPCDYYRFTEDGLKFLLEDSGLQIVSSEYTHSAFHVLGWMAEDFLKNRGIILNLTLRPVAALWRVFSKYWNTVNIETFPSVITVVAKKGYVA